MPARGYHSVPVSVWRRPMAEVCTLPSVLQLRPCFNMSMQMHAIFFYSVTKIN